MTDTAERRRTMDQRIDELVLDHDRRLRQVETSLAVQTQQLASIGRSVEHLRSNITTIGVAVFVTLIGVVGQLVVQLLMNR